MTAGDAAGAAAADPRGRPGQRRSTCPADEDSTDAGADDGRRPRRLHRSARPVAVRRRRRGARGILVAACVVVLGGRRVIGSFFWVRSQYFVGADDGQVVVYRGVDGSVLGLQLSSVAGGLLRARAERVRAAAGRRPACRPPGIRCSPASRPAPWTTPAASIARLAGQMLPRCPTAADAAPAAAPSTPAPAAATAGAASAPAAPRPAPPAPRRHRGARHGTPPADGVGTAPPPAAAGATGLGPASGALPRHRRHRHGRRAPDRSARATARRTARHRAPRRPATHRDPAVQPRPGAGSHLPAVKSSRTPP